MQEQNQSDAILDDLSCMLGCTRSSLHGAHQPLWHALTLQCFHCMG
jgi:hypothetical protein